MQQIEFIVKYLTVVFRFEFSILARARSAFLCTTLTLSPYRIICVSLTVSNIALNQSAASMTLYKLRRHSFSHFILATILEKC